MNAGIVAGLSPFRYTPQVRSFPWSCDLREWREVHFRSASAVKRKVRPNATGRPGVLVRLKRFVSGAVAVAMFCAITWAQAPAQGQAGQPQWKDRAEYDLFDAIQKEQDPKKKVGLLNQWKEKYPGSEFKKVRAGLLVQSYQAAGDIPNLVAASRELIDSDPKD